MAVGKGFFSVIYESGLMIKEISDKVDKLMRLSDSVQEAVNALPKNQEGADSAAQAVAVISQALREEMESMFSQYRKEMDANFIEQRKRMKEEAMWCWLICAAVIIAAVVREIYLK